MLINYLPHDAQPTFELCNLENMLNFNTAAGIARFSRTSGNNTSLFGISLNFGFELFGGIPFIYTTCSGIFFLKFCAKTKFMKN